MSEYFSLVDLNNDIWLMLLADLLIAIVLLGAMRLVSGVWGKFETTHELARKDNYAFGISIAGSIAALGIVLSGAVVGGVANNLLDEITGMLIYGTMGVLMVYIGSTIHDKWSLNLINKVALIREQNISVAIVDAGAMVAIAVMIRAILIWVEGITVTALVAVISGFVISQFLLLMVTRIRERRYARGNQGEPFQRALANGQLAIAIRHTGYLIGTSIAVSAASQLLIFDPKGIVNNILGWLVATVLITFILHFLAVMAKKVILLGINLTQEVDHQENIGVASIEMFITIAIALILDGLLH